MAVKKAVEYTGADETPEVKKQAVNILDLLLGSDISKVELPTQEVEVNRLSKKFGAPFIVVCRALSPEKYEEIQDMAIVVNGKDVDLDTNLLQSFAVIEGVLDTDGNLLLKNKDLMKKFSVPTPKELVKKLFLSGEIVNLYRTISDLSGFSDEAVTEVKN